MTDEDLRIPHDTEEGNNSDTTSYPLPVLHEAQSRYEREFGVNVTLGEAGVQGFVLNQDAVSQINGAEVIAGRLVELEQLYGRAPPALAQWTVVLTADLVKTNGMVAACNIDTANVLKDRADRVKFSELAR